jgi:hypothetical protein
MSIIESKNAIAQAESISKLTELAFIFIPLSFTSSLFGMQIKVGLDLGIAGKLINLQIFRSGMIRNHRWATSGPLLSGFF